MLSRKGRQRDQLAIVLDAGTDKPPARERECVAEPIVGRELTPASKRLGKETLGLLIIRLGRLGVGGLQGVAAGQGGGESRIHLAAADEVQSNGPPRDLYDRADLAGGRRERTLELLKPVAAKGEQVLQRVRVRRDAEGIQARSDLRPYPALVGSSVAPGSV